MKWMHKKWAYRNTTLLIVSLVVFLLLADVPLVHSLIRHIGSFGYIGSLLAGVFFVSTFTVAPASIVLFHLAQDFNPFLIALSAGLGAVIGDLLIFHLLKDRVFAEFAPLAERMKKKPVFTLFRSPYFAWLTPVVGAIIIASPFPDEIGIGMMGLSKIKKWQFVLLVYVLNTTGIFLIVLLAQ